MTRSFNAACCGFRVPCSQLRTALALTLRYCANAAWLALSFLRIRRISLGVSCLGAEGKCVTRRLTSSPRSYARTSYSASRRFSKMFPLIFLPIVPVPACFLLSTFRPCIAFPQIPLINSPTPACSTSSRSIRMIPNKLLDTRLVSILCFRVFIDIQSRRPLDSFLGVNPFPCTRFRNSFACHTSENSPVSPAIATDPKTPPNNPCICHTSETPLGSFRFSIQPACPAFPVRAAKGTPNTPSSLAQSPTPSPTPYFDLSPLFSQPCALFCTHQKLNPLVFNRFRTLCEKPPGGGGGRQ